MSCVYVFMWAPPADNCAGVQGGIAAAMIFGCAGAAYGTAKSGIGIAGVGTFRPDLIMKVSNLYCLDLTSSRLTPADHRYCI